MPGYALGSATAPVRIDIFYDHLCPGSAQQWPVMQRVAEQYGRDRINVVVHIFPLPYHRNAFIAAQGGRVVRAHGPSLFPRYVDVLFAHQDAFLDAARNMTEPQVLRALADVVREAGLMAPDLFLRGMADADLNWATRVDWKFACTRGVYGTPQIHVNGVYDDDASSYSVEQWRQLLDRLLPDR